MSDVPQQRKQPLSGITCVVKTCRATKRKFNDRTFFKFPDVSVPLFYQWVAECNLTPDDYNKKQLKICELHFEKDQIGKNKRLKPGAIPSCLLGDQEISDVLMCEHNTSSSKQTPDICNNCEKYIKNIDYYKHEILKVSEENSKLKLEISSQKKVIRALKLRSTITKKRNMSKVIKAKKICKEIDSISHVNNYSKTFSKMLLMPRKKSTKWNKRQRFIAQNLYFKSPSCYRYMSQVLKFSLPSKVSLRRWRPIKNLRPGFNEQIFSNLREKNKEMEKMEKYAVLIFDEVSIKRDLEYNNIFDEVDGYADDGTNRSNCLAKTICVFMLRGLFSKWKYVLSYFCSESVIKGDKLKELVLTNLNKSKEIGFDVVAIICDQGANNRNCFKKFNVTTDRPYFIFNNKNIYIIFDPPHLIKSLRNALIGGNLNTPDGVASWHVVETLYRSEIDKPTKMCTKLTRQHIYPNEFEKMRVKFAVQIFSRSVVAAIKTGIDYSIFEDSSLAVSTFKFFEKIDILFDNLNSKLLFDKNPNRSALQSGKEIEENIVAMITYFDNVKPCDKKTLFCLKGIQQTCKAVLMLLSDFEKSGMQNTFILTSRLNQDPIENLFSQIRSKGGNAKNPSIHEFSHILSQIMSFKILQPNDISNCDEDDDFTLLDAEDYNQCETCVVSIPVKDLLPLQVDNLLENTSNENSSKINGYLDNTLDTVFLEKNFTDEASIKYYIGYVLFKTKVEYCGNCKNILFEDGERLVLKNESLLFYKNYTNSTNFGSLHCPTQLIFDLCKIHIKIFEKWFSERPHEKSIKSKIMQNCISVTNAIPQYSNWFNTQSECYEHHVKILDFMILVLLRKNCKWIIQKPFKRAKVRRLRTLQE